jgi:hypothetical protein
MIFPLYTLPYSHFDIKHSLYETNYTLLLGIDALNTTNDTNILDDFKSMYQILNKRL